MARLARVVAAGVPHHVTQRGDRRQQTFFCDEDYAAYRELLAEGRRAADVEVWEAGTRTTFPEALPMPGLICRRPLAQPPAGMTLLRP